MYACVHVCMHVCNMHVYVYHDIKKQPWPDERLYRTTYVRFVSERRRSVKPMIYGPTCRKRHVGYDKVCGCLIVYYPLKPMIHGPMCRMMF